MPKLLLKLAFEQFLIWNRHLDCQKVVLDHQIGEFRQNFHFCSFYYHFYLKSDITRVQMRIDADFWIA